MIMTISLTLKRNSPAARRPAMICTRLSGRALHGRDFEQRRQALNYKNDKDSILEIT
jgi:hypothetical protein